MKFYLKIGDNLNIYIFISRDNLNNYKWTISNQADKEFL